jgi:hypothetical protein
VRNKIVVAIARELCAFIWALLRNQSCYLQIDEHLKASGLKTESETSGEPRFPATPPLRGTTNYH